MRVRQRAITQEESAPRYLESSCAGCLVRPSREQLAVRKETLVRVGGGAAILAGVLRAAASFASGGSEVERQSLYFIVDLLLLLGAFAAYAQNHEALDRWGAAGFLTTVAGILLVRSSRAVPGLDLYPAGALSVAIGWVLLSLDWWKRANGRAFVPVLFVLSIVTGLVGQIVPRAAVLFVASGVIFGAAMVAVGRQVLLATTPRRVQCVEPR
jgi:hypothetical protein